MISNINTLVKQKKIQEKMDEYYKLKNEYESLPERIKQTELEYYQEGGCNLKDDTDKTNCGMEYYLDIKREERKKALESFANLSNKNEEDAEELSSIGLFNTLGLKKLFNKSIEGMDVMRDGGATMGDYTQCDWSKNKEVFNECSSEKIEIDETNYIHPCKFNKDMDNLIEDLVSLRDMKKRVNEQKEYNEKITEKIIDTEDLLGKGNRERIRKGKVGYRHATFYDKVGESQKNAISILKTIYWVVFICLVVFYIYNKFYQIEKKGTLILILFLTIPYILSYIVKFIMHYTKRYHFIDTLYTVIAIGTVSLAGFLYFLISN